ncbi:MAG: hypothetical protein K2V38_23340, partial [Gemmataceae bacterium]|nr:hypothetical protein [Gemmataceae bacterium]
MTEPHPTPSGAGRLLGALVGLFAAWQLVYLPVANLIVFVPMRPTSAPVEPIVNPYQAKGTFTNSEPLQRTAEGAGRVVELWSEFSGQEQGWSLFAPGTPPYSVFTAVEFAWADGTTETLLSQYEPRDYLNPPARAPLVHNRHYNFEVQFVYPVWYAGPEAVAEHPEHWADLPDVVRSLQSELRAWLGWRLKEYLAQNPERSRPRSVTLKHRYISTPKPTEPTDAPRTVVERPFARWW